MGGPLVGVLMGSESDMDAMAEACETLRGYDIPFEVGVVSAHRSPGAAASYASRAAARGVQVLIAGAGAAAHLAGAIAARTTIPVIGVPLGGSPLGGLDALYSTVQMPAGVPVACVGINAARNAALLAVQILALSRPGLASRLRAEREETAAAAGKAAAVAVRGYDPAPVGCGGDEG